MRVLLQVPLSIYTGYGNDGIGLAQSLLRRGVDLYLAPETVHSPLPKEVALLLTKDSAGPFDLVISHLNPSGLKAPEAKIENQMQIGWTMWEWTNFDALPNKNELEKNLENFDALIAYDDVTSEALREYYAGPIIVLQGGYDPEPWEYVERDWFSPTFNYFMLGVLNSRKDPWKSITAFKELKEEYPEEFKPARLTLKTTAPGLHSKMEETYPWLKIYYEVWPTEVVKKFYASQHVLLAPSRGEGKNMPALEFQTTGGVVIGSNWAGHTEWMYEDYSYPVKVTLEAEDSAFPDTLNARVDLEHFKSRIMEAFRNPDEAGLKGRKAAGIIPLTKSWDKVREALFEKLRDLPGGERLWIIYSMTGGPNAADRD
jgi:glycosyltransferase involved in cell wall biosynthesis